MQRFGIDVSRWNGEYDFVRAKKEDKIQFVIIKIGGADGGLYKDKKFEDYYQQCKKLDIPVGVYYFGHALTLEQAKKEGIHIAQLIKGLKLEYPVFYDLEGEMLDKMDKRLRTDIVKTVMKSIEDAGFWPGIYSSSYVSSFFYVDEIKQYSYWAAKYVKTKPILDKGMSLCMWQYGGDTNLIRSTKIAGCVTDQDYCYIDFPELIKAKGVNGYKKTIASNSNKKAYNGTLPTKTLQYGATGNQVYYLQQFLNWYLNSNIKEDGIFGINTYKLVKRFQEESDGVLIVDGVFGAKSLAYAKSIRK